MPPKKPNSKTTGKKSARPSSSPGTGYRVGKGLVWAVLLSLTALAAASLATYDPADPPGHTVAPHNEQIQNAVGLVGAHFAHHAYLTVGVGVWVVLAGVAVWLGFKAFGRRLGQPVLRPIGVLLLAVGTSCLVHLFAPEMFNRPEGSGGLLASFINTELTTRFGFIGALIIVALGVWVGALLVADRVVLAVPRLIVQAVAKALQLPRPSLTLPRVPMPSLAFLRGRSDAEARDTLRKATSARKLKPGRTGSKVAATVAIDDAEPDEEYQEEQSWVIDDPDDEAAAMDPQDARVTTSGRGASRDDDPIDIEEDEDLGDAPSAYVESRQDFSPDELREKIKQLPINFAPKSNSSEPPVREVDLSGYAFPEMDLLEDPEEDFNEEIETIVRNQALQLESALREYKIEGEVVGIDSGPVITLYELRLAPGTKVGSVQRVSSDIARALKAQNIRIVPNMAGRDTVGIEVPNLKKEKVRLKELMTADPEATQDMRLPMFLGKDASGNPLIQDLGKMPHMLIAGTTGSGKSVCMNSIIMSFLYTLRPDELKLVLVDPKMVEMSLFKDIPHLMCPVVTEMAKAASILEWAVTKMDERYELLAEAGVRDIASYNGLGWEEIKERMEPATEEEEARIPKKLPFMVFIIDELADLMMTNKEVEGFIVRIAQKARAVGIHLILATQRPQANVVTGLIKSNMPCRVSFKVASGMDSRIVLDQKGAELLLGYGDMMLISPRSSEIIRAQGALVDDFEIRRTVKFLKNIAAQSFEPQLVQIKSGATGEDDPAERDELFDDAVDVVIETQRGSVSLLQRRLTIGYSRASRLIEQMAAAGMIGEYKGSQAREVLIGQEEWEALKAQAQADAQGGSAASHEADEQEDEYEFVPDDSDEVPEEYDDEYRQ